MAVSAFRGLRQELAVALNGRPRTLYETAKAVGRRSGDIQKVVHQMLEDGLLEADARKPTRGTMFWLSERHASALEQSLQSEQAVGLLADDQTLLLVEAPSVSSLDDVLVQADLIGAVAWAAATADRTMLFALRPAATYFETTRLLAVLEAAGCRVDVQRVTDLLSAAQLRAGAVAAKDAIEHSASAGARA